MNLFDLSGRVAIVTGGNGGIGLGMAKGLAMAGAAVVVAARNREKSEAAAIFRAARAKGVAVTTIDALIAAIALEHGATLFTLDKDFSRLAGITRLPLYDL